MVGIEGINSCFNSFPQCLDGGMIFKLFINLATP